HGLLRNLGGNLELTYKFSEALRDPAIDAKYYRTSIVRADANGNPTGTRVYFGDGVYKNEALSWNKFEAGDIVPELLGPVPVGTENFLYKIPFNSEAAWTGTTTYHALI